MLVLRRAREPNTPLQENSGPQLPGWSRHLGWLGILLKADPCWLAHACNTATLRLPWHCPHPAQRDRHTCQVKQPLPGVPRMAGAHPVSCFSHYRSRGTHPVPWASRLIKVWNWHHSVLQILVSRQQCQRTEASSSTSKVTPQK